MPLFKCIKCNCIENTALCNYFIRKRAHKPPLCSECDESIGIWHGKFKKVDIFVENMIEDEDGFLHKRKKD